MSDFEDVYDVTGFDTGEDEAEQMRLFTVRDEPEDVWSGLPEFEQRKLTPWRVVTVQLKCEADLIAFKKAIGADKMRQAGGLNSHNFWYPPIEPISWKDKEWAGVPDEDPPTEAVEEEPTEAVEEEPTEALPAFELVTGGSVPGGHRVLSDGVRKPFISPMRECNSVPLRHSDVVADIGAYVGTYAIRCARFPVRRVIAYEPTPGTFDVLSLTKLPNLEPVQAAIVGDDRTRVELHISRGIGVTNSIELSNRKARAVSVPAINYADAVKGATIIKIDVEGAEYKYPIVEAIHPGLRALLIDFHPIPGFDWVGAAERIIAGIEAAGFAPVIAPDWSNGWSRAGSWAREVPDPGGRCDPLMLGEQCCGCGCGIRGNTKSLCPDCFRVWARKHRDGFALVNRTEDGA